MVSQSPRFTKCFMLLSDSSQSYTHSSLLLERALVLLPQPRFQVASPLLNEGEIPLLEPYALQKWKPEMVQCLDQALKLGVEKSVLRRQDQGWDCFTEHLKVHATSVLHLWGHAMQSQSKPLDIMTEELELFYRDERITSLRLFRTSIGF